MLVKADGNIKTSTLLIIDESPSQLDMDIGLPLKGWEGRLLFNELRIWGIKRSECYITTVKKSSSGVYNPNELIDEIKDFKGNGILLLGNLSLHSLFDKSMKIGKWRGSPLLYKGIWCIPTVRPNSLAKNWVDYPLFILDIKRVAKIALGELKIEPSNKDDFHYKCGVEELEYINSNYKELSFDIETNRRNIITTISFANSSTEAYSFILSLNDNSIPLWRGIAKILANPDIKKIAQNGSFDIFHLADYHIPIVNYYWDTMVAQHIIYPELRKSLEVLASIYTLHPYWKNTARNDMYNYNMLDSTVTFEIYERQKEIIMLNSEIKKAFFMEMDVLQPALFMSYKGVKIDKVISDRALKSAEEEIKKLSVIISKLCGDINVNSPKQLMDYFYNVQGYKTIISRNTGKPTIDGKALNKLALRGAPEAEIILKYRRKKKLLSTYFMAKLHNGRVRTFFNVTGTVSGRFSSSKVKDTKEVSGKGAEGLNLQNLPHGDARRMLVADKGYTMVNIDLKQAEARIVAYIAGDNRMIAALESSNDFYIEVAKNVYGIEKVSDEIRQITKRLVHSANYAVGWRTFSVTAKISGYQAKNALAAYYMAYPRISLWHKNIRAEVSKTRLLNTPFGRQRYFFERSGEELYNKAINYIPQSVCVDYLNKAMLNIWHNIPESILLLQSHDGLLFELPSNDIDKFKDKINKSLNIEIDLNNYKVKLPFDIHQGSNYEEVS